MFSAIVLLALIPAALASCCPYYESSTCTDWALRYNLPCSLRSTNITVYIETDTPPFTSTVGSGVPFGLDIVLLNYFHYVYRINFQYEYVQFADLLDSVKDNVNSIGLSLLTITKQRIKSVTFAQYFKAGSRFLVRFSYTGTITGLPSLCGKKVGVITGSVQEDDVNGQDGLCAAGNKIVITSEATLTELIALLLNGNIDVVVTDDVTVNYAASQSPTQLKPTGIPYNVQPSGIACNKKNPELCCALVNAINSFIQSGFYKDLLNQYSFKTSQNGICPSRLNLEGSTCEPACKVPLPTCNALAQG